MNFERFHLCFKILNFRAGEYTGKAGKTLNEKLVFRVFFRGLFSFFNYVFSFMISDAKKEEVRDAADIVEVVSDYVKLKKSGSGFTGLCPYHNEKTPSFHVTPRLGIYKCFGCGESGDVFKFIMDQD